MKQKILELIADGRTEIAISKLLQIANSLEKDIRSDIYLISSRFKSYNTKKRRGEFGTAQEQDVEYSQINEALIDLVTNLPDKIKKNTIPRIYISITIILSVIAVVVFVPRFIPSTPINHKEFRELIPTRSGYFLIKQEDKWGYARPDSTIIIEPQYLDVKPFNKGMALVKRERYYGWIDTLNKVKIDFKYLFAMDFVGDSAIVWTSPENSIYINRKGEKIVVQTQEISTNPNKLHSSKKLKDNIKAKNNEIEKRKTEKKIEQQIAKLSFNNIHQLSGTIRKGKDLKTQIFILNTGNTTIDIKGVSSACNCIYLEEELKLSINSSGYLNLAIKTDSEPTGDFEQLLTLFTIPHSEDFQLSIKGMILPSLISKTYSIGLENLKVTISHDNGFEQSKITDKGGKVTFEIPQDILSSNDFVRVTYSRSNESMDIKIPSSNLDREKLTVPSAFIRKLNNQ